MSLDTQWLLEAGKFGKETDSPLEPPEGMPAYPYLDFSAVELISDF